VIKPEYQSVIDSHARFLTANKAKKLAVEGHTDESGGREYNLALGQKRAEAVRRALAVLGVLDAQVEAVSFGEEKPVDAASNEQAYAKNRRAELNYK
jgi:peptidoglycan-associated lipoprotein